MAVPVTALSARTILVPCVKPWVPFSVPPREAIPFSFDATVIVVPISLASSSSLTDMDDFASSFVTLALVSISSTALPAFGTVPKYMPLTAFAFFCSSGVNCLLEFMDTPNSSLFASRFCLSCIVSFSFEWRVFSNLLCS